MPALYVAIHAALVLALAAATHGASKERPRVARAIVLAAGLVAVPLQCAAVVSPRALANATGWADVFFFAELELELAAVLGVAVVHAAPSRGARLRASLLVLVLVTLAGWRTRELYAPRSGFMRGEGYVEHGVVGQTEPSSCAPAAAATLLRTLDLAPRATEAELALACLTNPVRGTHDLGLFRGIALAAPGKRVRYERRTLAELRYVTPCLGFVGLVKERVGDPELYATLEKHCQWRPGEHHAVVIFAITPTPSHEEAAIMGDPGCGLEVWSMEHFRALWDGTTLEVR